MWNDMGNGWGWMISGGLHMLLFWILVILAIAALIKFLSASRSGQTDGSAETALDSLKKRYASGEIDRETYLKMKADLEQ